MALLLDALLWGAITGDQSADVNQLSNLGQHHIRRAGRVIREVRRQKTCSFLDCKQSREPLCFGACTEEHAADRDIGEERLGVADVPGWRIHHDLEWFEVQVARSQAQSER